MRTELSVNDASHQAAIAVTARTRHLRAGVLAAIAHVQATWSAVPLRARVGVVILAGGLGAGAVGYLAGVNPHASPPEIAVSLRVLIVLALIVTGIYAQTNRLQSRMGAPLIWAGLFAVLWLFNGSAVPFFFTVGALAAGLAPTLFYALMLRFPSGQLSRSDKRFVVIAGQAMFLPWLLLMLSSPHAPFATPLMRCGKDCPDNLLFLGSRLPAFVALLRVVVVVAWLTFTCLATWRLYRRKRSAVGPLRDALVPVAGVAAIGVALLTIYLVADAVDAPGVHYFGAAYASVSVLIPLGVLGGLVRERLSIARAFTEFVRDLAASPAADPRGLMASALGDPSLQIAYRRPDQDTYVTLDGRPTTLDSDRSGRQLTLVCREHRPVAAVTYAADLCDQERYVHAAASAALLRLESAQLEADLRASAADLQASRIRLVEAAHAERRRIERDLHDSVQQQLVGLRLRLGMAADALKDEPEQSRRLLSAVEHQVDDVLATLRNLARGIYPALLGERGLRAALTAAAQRLPLNVAVHADGDARYPESVEVAVYFCCLEALQNVVKHGGPEAAATVRLWAQDEGLCFEVRDTGVGFDDRATPSGNGLTNMRDRVGAIGGTVVVRSRPGEGTRVTGSVPGKALPVRTP